MHLALSLQFRYSFTYSAIQITQQFQYFHNCSCFIIKLMNSAPTTYSKLRWTSEEEQFLRQLKEQKLISSWKTIAQEMNHKFAEKNRSGKQCRQRYMNYVRFGKEYQKIPGWTQVQDEQLFVLFMKHGAKWVKIGNQMPGRSENCLKNRFYGAMRKIIRKINRTTKEKRIRQKKPIKPQLLIRILQFQALSSVNQSAIPHDMQQFLKSLKENMIKIATNPEQSGSIQQVQALFSGILRFSSLSKTVFSKRHVEKKQVEQLDEEEMESASFRCSREDNDGNCQIMQQKTILENVKEIIYKKKENIILFSSQNLDQEENQGNKKIGLGLFGGISLKRLLSDGEKNKETQQ